MTRCPQCAASSEVKMEQFEKTIGKNKVVVPNVKARKCQNKNCEYRWVPGEEQARIDDAMKNFMD